MILLWQTEKDVKAIAEFFKNNFSDGWTENMISSAFSTGRFKCLSVVIDGNISGIITYSQVDKTVDIEDVVVKVDKRKNGIGTLLIKTVEDLIKKDGVSEMFLEVRQSNLPAIKLYEKMGFNKISERKKYYSDGENALVMFKEI